MPGTFTYTPASGSILNAGNQNLSVDFTPADNANYNAVLGTTVQLTVNKATPVITWTPPAAITYGTALSATQLNATSGGVAGTFTYTPASGSILNAGNQNLSVDFTPANPANYNAVLGTTVSITVNKATPVITWTPPAAITYGTALSATQLNATSGGVPGTFTYTPASGSILNAGNQNLSVDFTPADNANYNAVLGTTVQLTVNKATPVITWTPPAAITYGTALSATQLNATSGGVAGTFTYTPVSGSILNAGNQNLSVDFTPANPANYNAVLGTIVQLTVNKATPVITWTPPSA
ncbi:MAG: hypothetical protein JNK24_08730, partial [Alphaproteobacteria bacterium]|nr:hypothetical protein [Alphaproteobacteria bacterium]